MNNKSITPNPQQPVDRVPTGQLSSSLAELREAQLGGGIGSSDWKAGGTAARICSFDGDVE
jgi:bacteriocin leader peptide (microcyclamide/patellamide family)